MSKAKYLSTEICGFTEDDSRFVNVILFLLKTCSLSEMVILTQKVQDGHSIVCHDDLGTANGLT